MGSRGEGGGSVYLRGDVVWGAAEGERSVTFTHALPAHPKVSDLYVALAVEQHVIQLQIPERERERAPARRITTTCITVMDNIFTSH